MGINYLLINQLHKVEYNVLTKVENVVLQIKLYHHIVHLLNVQPFVKPSKASLTK